MTSSVAESRYRALVELSFDGILLQTDGRIAFANRAAQKMMGAKSEPALLRRRVDDFLEPPYLAVIHDELLLPGSTRTPFTERTLTRMDGTKIAVEVSAVPFVFENRPSVQIVVRDIGERVAARAAMLWTEAQFRVLAEQMPFVMWTSDLDGRVRSVIGDVSSPFGGQAAAALRENGILPLDKATPGIELADAQLREGLHPTLELTVGGRSYAIRLEPLRDKESAIVGRLGVAFDVTPWLRVQELLRDALRVHAIGQIAGGVAHEINNALAIIRVHAEELEQEGVGAARTTPIVVATDRAAEITRNLLAFAMRDVFRPMRMSLNTVAREVAETVSRTAPAHVAVDVRLAVDLPDVLGDEVSLSRALMNVCLNAIDAMHAGGRMTIETRQDAEPGMVSIEVTDSGIGMTPSVLAQVFEPFFSASTGAAKRVGLGLSMVQGAVKQHQGTVHLQSSPGVGTMVTLCIPAMAATGRLVRKPPSTLADLSKRPKVLVVDDEAMLRLASGALVERLGYLPVEAPEGATALARFRESPDAFAFVLLDVLMPGMSGIEVLAELLDLDPDARVILCTGYPREDLGADVFASGTVEYLAKPYSREQLATLVAKVTGRVGAAD